jgi:HEPN domain-containing protein
MNDREIANEWIVFADRDIESARFLLNMRPMPNEVICFHCQQCAEKAIKAILAFWALDIPHIHALPKLAALVNAEEAVLIGCDEELAALSQYGATVRYPYDQIPSEIEVHQAIAAAGRILASVKAVFG